MATGYVLVLAVLILGGVIATLGDRIGMRVGKARLSLFRLRPRQTATLVSILTGSIISASTLALLFGISRQLRTGVFELERIQSDLAQAKIALRETREAKSGIEETLADARQQQEAAQNTLQNINQSLNQAIARQRVTQKELKQTQTQLEQLRAQLRTVSGQAQQLGSEIQRLESERAALIEQQILVRGQIAERDRQIAERNRQIAERNREIAEREQTLSQLQAQQAILQEDVTALERQYEGLFRGNVAVGRNQSLVSGLIRVSNRQEARQAVDQLMRQANRNAINEIAPGINPERQVILIPQEEVLRLVNRIGDRQEFVVRVLSAANYIIGEPCVVADADPCIQVFIEAVPNEVIYRENQRLATVTVEPHNLTNQALVEKLNFLIDSLQFRARQDGIISNTLQIADGRTEALIAFLDEIKLSRRPIDIQAIAAEPIYTIGPLQVELLAVRNGRVLTRTDDLPRAPIPQPIPQEDAIDPFKLE